MKTILFPTDFSATSLNAFVYALQFAKKLNAQIITLHVYELPSGTFEDYHDFLRENYNISEWGNFENYKDEVPKLRKLAEKHNCGDLKISHVLHEGSLIAEDILKVAASEKADFIVMGTKGASGLKEVFIGSITQKVMSKASAPVLAVPDGCHYTPMAKLLFLSQFEASQVPAMQNLISIAKQMDAHIDVLYITTEHGTEEYDGIAAWKKLFPAPNIDYYILASNDFEGTVLDFATIHKSSIIAIQVRQKNFFERLFMTSRARELVFHATLPVLGLSSK